MRIILISLIILITASISYAEILERIVAYVDDEAITLTDLKETFREMQIVSPDITRQEVVNALINRLLLLKEAKQMKLDTLREDNQINEYIQIKIRSLIFIREEEIQRYYENNIKRFGNVPLSEVRDKIEQYLTEEETNKRLKEHLISLREKVEVRIRLEEGQ